VEIRYPGEEVEISQQEAVDALATAEAVWNFILNLLPLELQRIFRGERTE